jgi:DNA-binding transcriptional ArsR family regulator
MTERDSTIVKDAQNRANIVGFLSSTPGEHPIKEIADAVGINKATVGRHLTEMAKDKLVGYRQKGTAKLYRDSTSEISSEADNSHVMGEGRAARKSRASKGAAPKDTAVPHKGVMRDVELVVYGTQIVIGRNPDTGRLRFILEMA